jgi:DNA-binding beta-propeller fold protein YncE
MRSRWRICLVVIAIADVVLMSEPAKAQLPSTATLLSGQMNSMVVDPTTSHVFVSESATNTIDVLDFAGNLVTTIKGENWPTGMAVAGGQLYVLLNSGAIDEIDTTSLSRVGTLADTYAAGDLVAEAGALWSLQLVPIGGGYLQPSVVRVALDTGAISAYPDPIIPEGSELFAGPANSLIEISHIPLRAVRLDVSALPPAVVANNVLASNLLSNQYQADVAVRPDGTSLLVAGTDVVALDEYDIGDLQPTGVKYPASNPPDAIAVTDARGGLVAVGMNGIIGNNIAVYRLGHAALRIAVHTFNTGAYSLVPRGIAFSPDGTALFAVTGQTGGTSTFHVLSLPNATVSSTALTFGPQRVGTYGASQRVTITNVSGNPLTLDGVGLAGNNPDDFFGNTDCFPHGAPTELPADSACHATVWFSPIKFGPRAAKLQFVFEPPGSTMTVPLSGSGTQGYILAGAFGEVGTFGDAIFHGDAATLHLKAPMISLATTPNGDGYWLLGRDGGIFTFGNAHYYGSTGGLRLNKPIVAMSATPDGRGYWLAGGDGGIFTFGDAHYYGSTGGAHLNKPIDAMTSTIDGHGYWLVARDGGVFTFGRAHFYGSAANLHLVSPFIQVAPTPSGRGYWLVNSNGRIYPYGDAHTYGTVSNYVAETHQPVVGMAISPDGRGYWEATRNGAIGAFGDAHNYGSLANIGIDDVIAIAATAPPLDPSVLGVAAYQRSAARQPCNASSSSCCGAMATKPARRSLETTTKPICDLLP